MEKNQEKTEIQKRVEDFCKRKNITHSLLQESVMEFVEGHDRLFGDIVSTDELFARLEENLDKISFAPSKGGKLGTYEGRKRDNEDINEITIYTAQEELELSELTKKLFNTFTKEGQKKVLEERDNKRKNVKSTAIHELTHAAYTIKGKYGIGEKHIFSSTYSVAGMDGYRKNETDYIEGVVNYISSKIEGKPLDKLNTYEYETKTIAMLVDKIGDKNLIQAAWNSDKSILKEAYINSIRKK